MTNDLPPQYVALHVRRRRNESRSDRRGVLLLVVLSMLTLFLMLGAAFLVTTSRARDSARAFARLTFGGDEARVPHARLLDTVLLRVVRGGAAPIATGANAPAVSFESILGDKYGGNTLSGTVTTWSVAGPVMTGTMNTGMTGAQPTDLVGRVLTFTAPGRPVTSHRIIRAEPSSGSGNAATTALKLFLDIPVGARPMTTSTIPSPVIVNGREFAGIPAANVAATPTNEPWDGFDFHNPFLAQIVPGALISTSTVSRISFSGTPFISGTQLAAAVATGTGLADYDGDLIPDIADNDNDGTPDGLFLDYGLPDSVDAYGNPVQVRASVLIVDLDGRFNVNAHDSLARTVYSGTVNWTVFSGGATILTGSTPIGSGYGPAEINGAFMFVNAPPNAPFVGTTNALLFSSTAENPMLCAVTGGPAARLIGLRSGTAGSRYTSAQVTPRLVAIEGKYGERAPADWGSISATSTIQTPFLSATPARFARPGQPSVDDEISRISDRRSLAVTGTDQSLNYGIPPIWWTGSNAFNWAAAPMISTTSGSAMHALPRGIFNSPPDLHGRMRTITGTTAGIVPQMRFAKVEWANANSGTIPAQPPVQEGLDDPYELRLDTRRGFGGLLFDPSTGGSGTNAVSIFRDNPFTPAELEPVLRPYDIDTNRLPPRLAAMLGSVAEESRLKVTTDSWDTTAITGTAAHLIFGVPGGTTGWLQPISGAVFGADPLSGVIGGEVARGERFDLNRPLGASGTAADFSYPATSLSSSTYHLQRQAYFKDLYTLLFALNPTVPAATLAQWAANVTEFRDGDSRIIPFEYDTNPADGWRPEDGYVGTNEGGDRKVVWGAERPEIVIQEAFAWRNSNPSPGVTGTQGIVITLHRPWNARAFVNATGTISITAEPCDIAFDTFGTNVTGTNPTIVGTGTALNIVDLGKKSGPTVYSGTGNGSAYNDTANSTYPIWRLRIVGDNTTYLRFDTDTATPATTEVVVAGVTSGAGSTKPRLAPDGTLTISTTNRVAVGPAPTTGTATLTLSGSARFAPQLLPGAANTLSIYLERLSDPTIPLTVTSSTNFGPTTVTGSSVWTSDPLANSDTATSPIRYVVIDSTTISVASATIVDPSVPGVAITSARRATSNASTAFWAPPVPAVTAQTISLGGNVTLPSAIPSGNTAWFPWLNRPFVSAAELLLVPQGNSLEILQNYQKLNPSLAGAIGPGRSIPVPLGPLFEAVHVPTRFAGIHVTSTTVVATAALASAGISTVTTPVNHLSSFREPGRVNLNTVAAMDVWNAVVAGALPAPVTTATAAGFGLTPTSTTTVQASPVPAQSMFQLLTLSGAGTTVVSDTTTTNVVSGAAVPQSTSVLAFDRNPLHEIYTATRLANTVTPRSNVFAVWITLRESVPNDPDSVRYRRAFYIVDRSIPVGYEAGKDYNVWDTVRLRRIVE